MNRNPSIAMQSSAAPHDPTRGPQASPTVEPVPNFRTALAEREAADPSHANEAIARLLKKSFEAGFAAGVSSAQQSGPVAEPASPAANPEPTCTNDIIAALTPRRLEVLKLVARGLTNPEIASVLGISPNTVKAHLTAILETLDLSNRTEAAMALQDFEASQCIERVAS